MADSKKIQEYERMRQKLSAHHESALKMVSKGGMQEVGKKLGIHT